MWPLLPSHASRSGKDPFQKWEVNPRLENKLNSSSLEKSHSLWVLNNWDRGGDADHGFAVSVDQDR